MKKSSKVKNLEKQSKISRPKASPARCKMWIIFGIGSILVLALLALLSYYFYKQESKKHALLINGKAICFYEESVRNMFVLIPDSVAYSNMEFCMNDFVRYSEELEGINDNFLYFMSSFVSEKDGIEEIVAKSSDMRNGQYGIYVEYFEKVLPSEISFTEMNRNLPTNTEDFEDRAAKFQKQRENYEALLVEFESIDATSQFNVDIRDKAVESMKKMIADLDAIVQTIQRLIETEKRYRELYPPPSDHELHPRYLPEYNAASQEDRSALSAAYARVETEIAAFNDWHAEHVYGVYSELLEDTSGLNRLVAEMYAEAEQYDFPDLYVGHFLSTTELESETQGDTAFVSLNVDADGNFDLEYTEGTEQKKYDFDTESAFSASGNLETEGLTADLTVPVSQVIDVTFGDMSVSRTVESTVDVSISFVNGRYIVLVGGDRFDLRRT